ncbi:multiple inositol polyphosphate phosphatase 1-like isoform X2 [Cimex lectularius]|uniref:Multiple inositol polyphosphate phosphatase 1 n=1 Tax=Cimex lectularius TaxID=79782 RepID=A0A8I6RYN4_CIMLE|nr:multiple inositol polyphosphate phosphatase 1-like isoform X2 [Cimex lectularius]
MTRAVLGLVLFVAICVGGDPETCLKLENEGLRHLSTKTPYRIIANKKDSPVEFKGCTPIKILGVIRHGTRTPGKKATDEITERLNNIKNHLRNDFTQDNSSSKESNKSSKILCEEDLKNIQRWNFVLESEGEKFLTHEGEDEMIELAERISNRFPSLLDRHYDNDTFYFRFTDTQRTRESAKYFTMGLFGRKESKRVWYPDPIYADPVLRFYKLCSKWRTAVKKNPASKEEMEKLKNSVESLESCQRISKRLGLNYTLPYNDVYHIYLACSFETAWNKYKRSPWCSVFNKKDFKVIEYGEELKYYWKDGYGFDINHKQACPLIHDIFSKLSDRFNATFYFTHSGTVLKLLSHLGLYKDEFQLMHDTASKIRSNRKWRVSFIDTFGANVVFVLYRCGDELKVLTMHQERIVQVPGCPKGLCPLRLMKEILVDSIEHCNFTNLCSIQKI